MFVSETHLPQLLPPAAVAARPSRGRGFVTDSLQQAPEVFARHWLIHARRSGPSFPASQEFPA
jgi:hypothetical protein